MTDTSWTLRTFDGVENDRVRRFTESLGCSAVYVCNALDERAGEGLQIGLEDRQGELVGLLWFGVRGNLVVLESGCGDELPLDLILSEVRSRRTDWRIALGPMRVLKALVATELNPPLLLREQIYYEVDRSRIAATERRSAPDEIRPAHSRDLKRLVEAALELNEVDLNVPAWRVDKSWLRESVRRRLAEGRTFVIGPVGRPLCKLDLGSDGPAGSILEGVFTLPEARGQGLATKLTATVAHQQLLSRPQVCLHVARDNVYARRAYEQAGLTEAQPTGLLLRNT